MHKHKMKLYDKIMSFGPFGWRYVWHCTECGQEAWWNGPAFRAMLVHGTNPMAEV